MTTSLPSRPPFAGVWELFPWIFSYKQLDYVVLNIIMSTRTSTRPSRLGRWRPAVHCCPEATNMITFPFRQSPCSPAVHFSHESGGLQVQEPGVRAILALLIGNAGAVRDPTCTFLSIATRDHNPPSSPFWLRRKRSVHQLPFQRRCDSLGITSITRNPKTARNRRVA